MPSNDYPVHSEIEVIEGKTISKSEEWWKAAILFERYGRKIGVYLWHLENGEWKRKQKYVIRELEDWKADRHAIEELLPKLVGDSNVGNADSSNEDSEVINQLVDESLEN